MTRQEIILKAAEQYSGNDEEKRCHFIDVCHWADDNPDLYSVTRKAIERERQRLLQRAIEFVEKFAYNSVITDKLGEKEKQAIVIFFKEYMEEQQ